MEVFLEYIHVQIKIKKNMFLKSNEKINENQDWPYHGLGYDKTELIHIGVHIFHILKCI